MFPADRIAAIFGNIEDIYEFARDVLVDLQKHVNTDEPEMSQIGTCFLRHVSLHLYICCINSSSGYSKAVTIRFFSGGVTLSLSAVSGGKIAEWGSVGGGGIPYPENFCIFLFKNGEFLCLPAWVSFLFGIFFTDTIYRRHDITNMIEMQQLCFIQYSV